MPTGLVQQWHICNRDWGIFTIAFFLRYLAGTRSSVSEKMNLEKLSCSRHIDPFSSSFGSSNLSLILLILLRKIIVCKQKLHLFIYPSSFSSCLADYIAVPVIAASSTLEHLKSTTVESSSIKGINQRNKQQHD